MRTEEACAGDHTWLASDVIKVKMHFHNKWPFWNASCLRQTFSCSRAWSERKHFAGSRCLRLLLWGLWWTHKWAVTAKLAKISSATAVFFCLQGLQVSPSWTVNFVTVIERMSLNLFDWRIITIIIIIKKTLNVFVLVLFLQKSPRAH